MEIAKQHFLSSCPCPLFGGNCKEAWQSKRQVKMF